MTITAKKFLARVSSEMRGNTNLARKSLINKIEEFDYSPEEALRSTIKRMGVSFFAHFSKLPENTIKQFVNKKRQLTPQEMDRYLRVFKVSLRDGKIVSRQVSTTSRHSERLFRGGKVVVSFNQPCENINSGSSCEDRDTQIVVNGSMLQNTRK